MRATFFLLLAHALVGLFLWVTLSGALLIVGCLFWLVFVVVSVGYTDTVVLYLLGAREIRSSDQKDFSEAASQEAYKLAVRVPQLYFYNGSLERAFVLQGQRSISLVLSKSLIEKCSASELRAICFGLLLQAKKGMASKRTKSLFLLGLISWLLHSLTALILMIIPFKDLKKVTDWTLNYLLHPLLSILFKLMLGQIYFKKLSNHLSEFPLENELLDKVGMKLRKPFSYYSLPSRKLLELSSIYKSRHFQSIIALEFLPHEWDYLFKVERMKRAE
jgi:hypothetical protein